MKTVSTLIASAALISAAAPALAHSGHAAAAEQGSAHWFAGDHLAFLIVAGTALAVAFSRGRISHFLRNRRD